MSTTATATEARPVVKIVDRGILSYLGSRVHHVTTHHDKSRDGLRTVRMTWIDDATPENGSWPAGTTTEKVVKGNAMGAKFEVIEDTKVVA
ncbi:hypothetical protein SEA_FUZZBUSTER_71 [Microbacterium phage FuzzBuster]|uniref:Uncharacterized protein n=1 Tax=Microbacterium phage FuzzBuster TaxID=2590935 RepID=A0A516KV49_9CAUD|nr:hypothetical protein SEA_FUZZBUSTER_71 [Microbacterium phage FuzzBuster]